MKLYQRSKIIFCIVWAASGFLFYPVSAAGIEFGLPALKGSIEHISSADADETDSQADVSLTFTNLGMTLPINLTENSDFEIKLSGGLYYSDWSNIKRLAFSNGREPWDDLYSADLGLAHIYKWNKKWTSFFGSGISAGWEEDTDGIISCSCFLGAGYRFGQALNWKASLGFGFGRGPEESSGGLFRGPFGTALGPFGSISWNEGRRKLFQPGWSFNLKILRNSEIAYVFNEHWAVNCNFGVFGKTFRLADDNNASPGGLLSASFKKVGFAVDFRPIKTITLSLGFSEYFNKEFDIQDENGDSLQTIDVHDSFGGRFSVNWAF